MKFSLPPTGKSRLLLGVLIIFFYEEVKMQRDTNWIGWVLLNSDFKLDSRYLIGWFYKLM